MNVDISTLKQRLISSETPAPWQETYGVSLSEMSDIQILEHFYPEQTSFPYRKLTQYLSKAILENLKDNPGDVLEIGCGAANISRMLYRDGDFDSQHQKIVALDIDQNAIDCAKEIAKIEEMSIDFVLANFLELSDKQHQFSAIVIFSVLEHIEEYGEWISKLHDLLRPGGSVFVVVPSVLGGYSLMHDFDWPRLRWKAQSYNYHPGQHCNHFWFGDLKNDFRKRSMNLTKTFKFQGYVAVPAYVLHKLRQRRFTRHFSYLDYYFSKMLPVNLATRLCVFTRTD